MATELYHFIGGKRVKGTSGRFTDAYWPMTGEVASKVPLASAADYVQAPGSTLAFASRYDGELFTGRFGDFQTRLSFDPARPEAGTLDVSIGLASADTGNDDRDSTLKTADFFNIGKFAQARYRAELRQ